MLVKAILRQKGSHVVTVEAHKTLGDAIGLLNEHRIGALVVTKDGGDLCGIITERDIMREFGEHCDRPSDSQGRERGGCTALVQDVMTGEVVIGVPDDEVDYVMAVMTEKRIRHLPVIDDGVLVGIVSIGDVVNAHVEETESEVRLLKDYVQGRSY